MEQFITKKNTTITGSGNSYKTNSVTMSTGSGGAICNKEINSKLSLLQEEYRNNVAPNGSAICNYATNCKINCSILVGNTPIIYSKYSMDARFNWWGRNNGNNSFSGVVDCTKPVIFSFSVTNIGVTNHIRTINVFVSVYKYNDSGVLRPMNLYLHSVQISLSNGLGTITTDYQITVTKTLSDSITSITATLDNQPLTASIIGSKTIDSYSLPDHYDDVIDVSNITVTHDDEHITLFVDEVACELADLLNREFLEINLDDTRIILENNTLKFKYYDNDTHNVVLLRRYYTDETLSEDVPTTTIKEFISTSKTEKVLVVD